MFLRWSSTLGRAPPSAIGAGSAIEAAKAASAAGEATKDWHG